MTNQTLAICFTDLKDSSSLTEAVGYNTYLQYLKDHFSVAETLTKLAGGDDDVRNTGSGNMIVFKSEEQAISFALQLQEFYAGTALPDKTL